MGRQGSIGRPFPSFAPLIADGLEVIHTYMTSLLFRPMASAAASARLLPNDPSSSTSSSSSEFYLSLPPIDHQQEQQQAGPPPPQLLHHQHHHQIPITSASIAHSDQQKHLIQPSPHARCCSGACDGTASSKMCSLISGNEKRFLLLSMPTLSLSHSLLLPSTGSTSSSDICYPERRKSLTQLK